jgi:hypothetical protein
LVKEKKLLVIHSTRHTQLLAADMEVLDFLNLLLNTDAVVRDGAVGLVTLAWGCENVPSLLV